MAFLRQHKRSPFWYLKRRNLDTATWEEKSTGLRVDDPGETRKAQRTADKATAEEKRVGTSGHSPAFLAWVPRYLATHWQNEESRRRYVTAWQPIRQFLAEHDIVHPRQIRYEHARDYLEWRLRTPVYRRAADRNTALLELKFLSQLVNEAIRHGFADANPLNRLGIARTPARVKPDFTNDQIRELKERFAREVEWMLVCSEIALYTGCRFSETAIPVSDINLAAGLLRLTDAKRNANDRRKQFLVPIDDHLRPLLQRIVESGASQTCEITRDKNGRINSVIKATVGKEYSFHCYRVTFVTRCHRAGLSESQAMRLVNHSSKLVHQIYSRLSVDDVRPARARLDLP